MHEVIYERLVYLHDGQPFFIEPWRETSDPAARSLADRALAEARRDVLVQIARLAQSQQPSVFEGR